MKYIDILNQSADEKAAANNVLTNEEANLALQSEILSTKRQLSAHESVLNDSFRVKKINFTVICDIKDDITMLQRKLEQLEQLKNELF
jgi:hypothetical protein